MNDARLTIRLSEEEKKTITDLARGQGISTGEFFRRMLHQYVLTHAKDNK